MKWGCGQPTLRDSRRGGWQPHFRTRVFGPEAVLHGLLPVTVRAQNSYTLLFIYGGGYYVQQD